MALAWPFRVQNYRLACSPAPQTLAKVEKRLKASPPVGVLHGGVGQSYPTSGLAILAPVILKLLTVRGAPLASVAQPTVHYTKKVPK